MSRCYAIRSEYLHFIIVLKRRGGKGVSQRWNRGAAVSCFRGKAPAYNSDQHGKCRYLGTMKKKKKKNWLRFCCCTYAINNYCSGIMIHNDRLNNNKQYNTETLLKQKTPHLHCPTSLSPKRKPLHCPAGWLPQTVSEADIWKCFIIGVGLAMQLQLMVLSFGCFFILVSVYWK